MSVIKVNNITNLDGTSGPVFSGITTVSSTSHFVVPVGNTFRRSVIENVVNDGLVLYLDAGNDNSYPGIGTSWTDLSGQGITGTLTNGPTYSSANGGSIVFDGVDDRVNVSSSALGLSSGTLCFWIKSGTSRDIYHTQGGDWNQNTLWGDGTNLVLRISNGTPYPGDVAISSSLVFDNNFHFVCTQWTTGGERSIWLDGTKRASLTNTLQYVPSSTFEVGYKSWSPSYYSGNMYNVMSYNRALSATEISQNFNALKDRYV
jgi:Concanavalin A-like lectin/glucanases superfamily